MRRLLSGLGKCAPVAILVAIAPQSLLAADFTLQCARADVINPAWQGPLTFTYVGTDSGTLKVGGVFGDFKVAASRAPLQIQPGEMGEAVDASATAQVKLPPLTDLDACIVQTSGGAPGDLASVRDQCLQKLGPASSMVDAVAQIRIGFTGTKDDSGEDAFVVFRLKYEAPSKTGDGVMVVEAFPAQCTLKK